MVGLLVGPPLDVDHVVMGFFQLRLGKKRQQAFVAAMAVYDDDFLAAVAGHFVGGFLQKFQLEVAAVGDGSGFVLGFEDLAEIVLRKNDRIFLFGGVQRGVADVDQVGAEREVRPVLLENAERQYAGSFCLLDALAEIVRGQFLPVGGEFLLGGNRAGQDQRQSERKQETSHGAPHAKNRRCALYSQRDSLKKT